MRNISFRNDILPLKNVLYRLALRITQSHEDAQDVVQDTLIKVWDKRDEWQNILSIEAYSLRICRNIALDKIRKASASDETLDGKEYVIAADNSSNPHDSMLGKERMEHIRRIVGSLPEKQRTCFQLRDIEGKSYKEIASILDVSEEQVKVNIFRARQTLKNKYQEIDNYGL